METKIMVENGILYDDYTMPLQDIRNESLTTDNTPLLRIPRRSRPGGFARCRRLFARLHKIHDDSSMIDEDDDLNDSIHLAKQRLQARRAVILNSSGMTEQHEINQQGNSSDISKPVEHTQSTKGHQGHPVELSNLPQKFTKYSQGAKAA
jgi:hypothetical protein